MPPSTIWIVLYAIQLLLLVCAGEELLGKEDLAVLLMGDTQYHFICENSNPPCLAASRMCKERVMRPKVKGEENPTMDDCRRIESRYANRIQRKALEAYIERQRYKPAALVINGDLTDFGHPHQIDEFKNGWMSAFPVPLLLGLGNHDIQNNVNDCIFNRCATGSIELLVQYALSNDYPVNYNLSSKVGCLAYNKRVCSATGLKCAHVIQLNNAIDYEVSLSSFGDRWTISSPLAFLKTQLNLLRDMSQPILINVHQNEDVRMEKLKQILGDWIYETRTYNIKRKIGVFFAHIHGRHEMRLLCFHGVPIPFVYVGSVPNNRFTVMRFRGDGQDELLGYAAREKGPQLLDTIHSMWDHPCNRSTVVPFLERQTSSPLSLSP